MSKTNPFSSKGFVERDGLLVRAPSRAAVDLSAFDDSRVTFVKVKSTDESKLNKTETAYLAHLRRLNPPWIGIQCVTLKLADDTRLTPDFCHIDENGRLVMTDVKGFQREDALIKMKVAARTFGIFDFVIVKKNGLSWAITKVNP